MTAGSAASSAGAAGAAACAGASSFFSSAAGAALFDPKLLALGLVVAIVSSAIPYSLEMVALRGIPKRSFGVMLSLEPAAGAVAGLLILGEYLALSQWLAIGLIIAAPLFAGFVGAALERHLSRGATTQRV